MNLTDPSFLGIIKVGAAHSEWLTFFNTPNWQSLEISFFQVTYLLLGITKTLAS